MAVIPRQTWALTKKTLIIAGKRHWASTVFRAFVLPVIFVAFLSFARYLFVPASKHGIGSPADVQNLADVIPDNRKLVLINNGAGSDVDDLIEKIAGPVRDAGKKVVILNDVADLPIECKQSLRGSSSCYSAAVFNSYDPDTGLNYTLRGDSAFGTSIFVDQHDNEVQKYILPLQNAIDMAFIEPNSTVKTAQEQMFTPTSEEERKADIRRWFARAMVQALGIAFFLGHVGIIYQMVGFIAMERELGLSQLIESMGGRKFSRMLGYHLAYDLIWLPGVIIMAIILGKGLFTLTSLGIMIIFYILVMLACSSWALFGAAFFKKAQLSGISVTVVTLLLGIISQVTMKSSAVGPGVLGFLFPSSAYVVFLAHVARFEHNKLATNIAKGAPAVGSANFELPGIIIWVGLIFQILFYPILAMLVEKWLYGTASKSRISGTQNSENAVEIVGYSKEFVPGFWSKLFGAKSVLAVNNLSLQVRKGTIFGLLGANGSGKTTTLESVAGLNKMGKLGEIRIDGVMGICPQKNVLWDFMTVEEHVRIWNKIKCDGDDQDTLTRLIERCDLTPKAGALSKTLSGGQKRKLQLAIMFTGGSTVCCIDEVSSGIDPLSRRKLWDIILSARGERTMMLTTHFLDEADLLSDYIAILSKGQLKCEGSAIALKEERGGGFRIFAPADAPDLPDCNIKRVADATVYRTPTSIDASRIINKLEQLGITDYQVNGPTIEDVFLKVAEETAETLPDESADDLVPTETKGTQEEANALRYTKSYTATNKMGGIDLESGRKVSVFKQVWVMFRKRITIAKRGWLPLAAAFLLPILASALTMLFVKDYTRPGCSRAELTDAYDGRDFMFNLNGVNWLAGPRDAFSEDQLKQAAASVLDPGGQFIRVDLDSIKLNITWVDSYDEFNDEIEKNYKDIYPGGIYFQEDRPIFAVSSEYYGGGPKTAIIMQNLANQLFYGENITTTYQELDKPFRPGQGDTLQFVTYFGLVMAAFPAFFALYPTVERIRNIRPLHYSNGARAVPLWFAYALFDFIITTVASVIIILIFKGASSEWFGLGPLFVVIMLYTLCAILIAYLVSLIAKSQLSAFAFTAGGQACLFLLYFVAYMSVINNSDPADTDKTLKSMHYGFAAISPIASLVRALFISLNSFSIICRGESVASNPGAFDLYGAPITYLIIQAFVLYGLLIWLESGRSKLSLRRSKPKAQTLTPDTESVDSIDKEIHAEVSAVDEPAEGLRVAHVAKTFGSFRAVKDVSFTVPHSQVFALLGPNGAGKTTTINMIRGELYTDSGDVYVENIPISTERTLARTNLGVCPQFDAIDKMTVQEHLEFYARVRGVMNVQNNVENVLKAVGLETYRDRMAEALSGGNKRKLSLGIALMGNPTVLLLDEPSSGMDAASKRVMWRTLAAVTPGRSLVLTTHSMEEADALASRAGIMAGRMLALGTVEGLRRRYGERYFIQLLCKSAPTTSQEEMDRLKRWVASNFRGAEVEESSCNGQVRFSIPSRQLPATAHQNRPGSDSSTEGDLVAQGKTESIAALFDKLEKQKEELGLEYYSVARTSLEDIFLDIVRKEGIKEEGYGDEKKGFWAKLFHKK
ncbi:ABC transporter [Ascobolus immersus RN42]|uniref:ABC transporter n=1 Tax=Ascobolus immersus RN42 TaxID=1160509 RepID=A0A3N4IH85_ASCIM|nr:ABC transporter [Ascobolus immersus RN42]